VCVCVCVAGISVLVGACSIAVHGL